MDTCPKFASKFSPSSLPISRIAARRSGKIECVWHLQKLGFEKGSLSIIAKVFLNILIGFRYCASVPGFEYAVWKVGFVLICIMRSDSAATGVGAGLLPSVIVEHSFSIFRI